MFNPPNLNQKCLRCGHHRRMHEVPDRAGGCTVLDCYCPVFEDNLERLARCACCGHIMMNHFTTHPHDCAECITHGDQCRGFQHREDA